MRGIAGGLEQKADQRLWTPRERDLRRWGGQPVLDASGRGNEGAQLGRVFAAEACFNPAADVYAPRSRNTDRVSHVLRAQTARQQDLQIRVSIDELAR